MSDKDCRFCKIATFLSNTAETTQSECDCVYFGKSVDLFARLIHELEKARVSIYAEFFLIEKGVLWHDVMSILIRKAESGLDVRIVYDPVACLITLPKSHIRELQRGGVKIRAFKANNINHRDHRKIVVIDGHTTFCGGVNLSDRYANLEEKFGHWKDSGVMVTESSEAPNASLCIPLFDVPRKRITESVLLQLIMTACTRVWITTPYFMCGQSIRSALFTAALSGIDVRIVTPYIADKKAVKSATESYYDELLANRVRVFEYTQGFIHAKNVLSDDIAMVGSANLDYRSLYLNYECAIITRGEATEQLERDFNEIFSLCKEITAADLSQRSPIKRVTGNLCRVFAFFL
jgi:cardiolipin synthase